MEFTLRPCVSQMDVKNQVQRCTWIGPLRTKKSLKLPLSIAIHTLMAEAASARLAEPVAPPTHIANAEAEFRPRRKLVLAKEGVKSTTALVTQKAEREIYIGHDAGRNRVSEIGLRVSLVSRSCRCVFAFRDARPHIEMLREAAKCECFNMATAFPRYWRLKSIS